MTVHGQKYPKHDRAEKGSVFNGECNRTACNSKQATWFNFMNYGYYCQADAHAINRNPEGQICIEVDRDLTIAEMDRLHEEGNPWLKK